MAAQIATLIPPLLPPPPRSLPKTRAPKPTTTSRLRLRRRRRLAVACASSGGDDGGPPTEGEKRQGPSLPAMSEIRWGELLTPEPANAAAVALTAALAWAGASLLLQLAFISAAAVKYSFVAALPLFVLIAFL